METIGQAAITALETALPTTSSTPAETSLTLKPLIRLPTTVEECRSLKEWAETQATDVIPVTSEQLAKHLAFMAAALPSKVVDKQTAQMRVAVYLKILGKFSNAAIAFMARRACETLEWFPTPSQCLAILDMHIGAPGDKQQALHFCQQFWQQRHEAFLASLEAGDATDAQVAEVPEQWRKIAVEKGYLRRLDDGSYVIRQRPAPDPEA